jgi:serine/threonine-protein kinase HipA
MARESFVFVQLPGETTSTVAGLFTHEESITPALGTFVYGKSFLRNPKAVPLDPIALPLREIEFKTTLTEGFFGVIRDALPDDWGRHVIQKLYGDRYETTFDCLLLPSSDRFGALSFGKGSKFPEPEPPIAKLDALTDQVLVSLDKIDRDLAITDAEKRTAIAFGGGTHAGGARPKFTAEDKGLIWLAKLNRFDDKWNVVRVEAAMLDLARTCGIRVPEHRVERIADNDVLLVQRFDRNIAEGGVLKNRGASAASVFRADEEYARNNFSGSYMRLSRELARWGVEISSDRRELYRRVVFNCLTGISDDHERNHALIAEGNHFRLAPAFDLSPTIPTTRARRQALAIGASGGESTRANLLSAVSQFELTTTEAEEIIVEIKDTVTSQWRASFLAREVDERDIKLLSACFANEYFEAGRSLGEATTSSLAIAPSASQD